MSKKHPKKLWATIVSSGGARKITRVYFDQQSFDTYGVEQWWDKEGNFDVEKIGLVFNETFGYTRFSSEKKKDVETFLLGAEAVLSVLRDMSAKVDD